MFYWPQILFYSFCLIILSIIVVFLFKVYMFFKLVGKCTNYTFIRSLIYLFLENFDMGANDLSS